MKKPTKINCLDIKDCIWFKEEFLRLPKGTIVYVKEGKLILEEVTDGKKGIRKTS